MSLCSQQRPVGKTRSALHSTCVDLRKQPSCRALPLRKRPGRFCSRLKSQESQQEERSTEAATSQNNSSSSTNSTLEFLSLLAGGPIQPPTGDQSPISADGQPEEKKDDHQPHSEASSPDADEALETANTSSPGLYSPPLAKPRVTYVLLSLNLLIYMAGIGIALRVGGEESNQFFLSLAKSNEALRNGEVWRLLTSVFMHAGVLHLGLNTLALAQLGPEAEAVLGPQSFLTIYLLSGLSGSVASFITSPRLVTVGASGAIFGLLGAITAYIIKNRQQLTNSNRQLLNVAGIVVANILLGLGGGNIDNAGHIGGLTAGLVLGFGMCPLFIIEHPGGDKNAPGSVRDLVSTQQRIATASSFALVLSLLYMLSLTQSIGTDTISV